MKLILRVFQILGFISLLVACPVQPTSDPTITEIVVTTNTPVLAGGVSTAISGVVKGTGNFNPLIIWSTTSGTLSQTNDSPVLFTAPRISATTIVTITATSIGDKSKSKSVDITINPADEVTAISLTASKVALRVNDSSLITAGISGTGVFSDALTWKIESSSSGSLSNSTGSTVTYTAPSSTLGRVVRITARSVQTPTIFKTLFMSVNPMESSISAGQSFVIAVKTDGNVVSWGANNRSQLGNTNTNIDQPIPVNANSNFVNNIVAVAAGQDHSLAIKSDGTLLSWGSDDDGKLGDGGFFSQGVSDGPKIISGISGIIAVAAGRNFSLALKSDGTVLSWGANGEGELGTGGSVDYTNTSPITIPSLSNVIAISAASGSRHALALLSDGTLKGWGLSAAGQLGEPGSKNYQTTPVTISGIDNIVSIATGEYSSWAIKSDGSLFGWGISTKAFPNGDQSNTPTFIQGATDIVAVAPGNQHTLALKANGTLLGWGQNVNGELGLGNSSNGQNPGAIAPGLNDIAAIAAGATSSYALTANGKIQSWGADTTGQLGNGGANETKLAPGLVSLGDLDVIRTP